MKRQLKHLLTLLTALFGLAGCGAQEKGFRSVGVTEFETVIADASVVRLDVRSAEEYADGHIASTLNIDVLQDDFTTKAREKLSPDKTVALYCRSGKRSKKAAKILADMGYQVVELNVGFNGWVQAGRPIVK